jgi:hypothetical protein
MLEKMKFVYETARKNWPVFSHPCILCNTK